MEAKSVYAKHLDTEEVREFESLSEAKRFFGLQFSILAKQVESGRIYNNNWVMSFDKEKLTPINRLSLMKTIYVYDIKNKVVYAEKLSMEEVATKYNLSYMKVKNSIYKGSIVNGRDYGFSYNGDKLEHYIEKAKKHKPKWNKKKRKANKSIPTYTIIDFENGLQKKQTSYLTDIAKMLGVSYSNLSLRKNNRQLIKKRYAIATNRQDIKYFEEMRIKKYAKKKEAKKKAPKVDLTVNGELVYREPNRPVKRIGKLGKEEIKNRFKK